MRVFCFSEKGEFDEVPAISQERYVFQFTWESSNIGRKEFQFNGINIDVFLESRISLRVTFLEFQAVGLDVIHVDYNCGGGSWRPMARNMAGSFDEDILSRFRDFSACGSFMAGSNINFRFGVTERAENYSFGLVDLLRGPELWSAAIKREYTDVEFLVDDHCFAGHSCILAARSRYFCQLFRTKETYVIQVDILNSDEFQTLLYFIYNGCLSKQTDPERMMVAAERYQIETLKSLCEIAITTSLNNVDEEDLLLLDLTF